MTLIFEYVIILIVRYRQQSVMRGSEDMNEEMTTKEVSRLIDWLKSKGLTYEEIEECIDYISKEKKD